MLRRVRRSKLRLTLILLASCAGTTGAIAAPPVKLPDVCDQGSQVDINACNHERFEYVEAEMKRMFAAVLARHKDSPRFLEKIKAAQERWLKWREAEMDARFPEPERESHYGSVFPSCWSLAMIEITDHRLDELRDWVEGVEEGDVCSGSKPINGDAD